MSITDTPTAPSPSKFDVALEKAKRAIALRAEVIKLEGDVRNIIHILTHEASRVTKRSFAGSTNAFAVPSSVTCNLERHQSSVGLLALVTPNSKRRTRTF